MYAIVKQLNFATLQRDKIPKNCLKESQLHDFGITGGKGEVCERDGMAINSIHDCLYCDYSTRKVAGACNRIHERSCLVKKG